MARPKNTVKSQQVTVRFTDEEIEKLNFLTVEVGLYGSNPSQTASLLVFEFARFIVSGEDVTPQLGIGIKDFTRGAGAKKEVTLSLTEIAVNMLENHLKELKSEEKAGFEKVNTVSDFIELLAINRLAQATSVYEGL